MASEDSSTLGMTVLELLLATAMLVVFTGVMAAVMEVTLNFMGEAECPVDVSGVRRCNDETTEDASNGALIDRQRIEALFDQLEQVLVQPGISSARIDTISGPLGDSPRAFALLRYPLQFGQQVTRFLNFLFLHFPVVITFACGPLVFRRHLWKICLTRPTLWQHLVSTFFRPCRPS